MRRDKHYSHNNIYFWKIEYQIRWTIYPSIASLLEASWQIRLHETKPLSTFSCRNGTNTYFVIELAATAACDNFTEQFPGVLLRLFWHRQRPWLSFRGVQMGFYSISSWHFWRNLTVTMTHVYCNGYGCLIMQLNVSSHANCVIASLLLKTECPKV